ncbi:hypothetical protein [Planobispora takensis]|uniref:hypothetical protein n=1 Tax=Planobispora takensis TaxID=1367882 RepID=UPI001940C95B|nr:hypothetical protein [Planobispora takensis]
MVQSFAGFLPWIVYGIIATGDNWRYGALAGLVIALAVIVIDRRSHKAWDEMVIETSGAVFFALSAVFSYAAPDSPLTPYGPALVNVWLAATAWGSLAIGRPFTLGIARRMADPKVWESPMFYRVNAVITGVWAASFTVAAAGLAVLISQNPHATAAVITVKVVTFVAPALFTARYPKLVAARAQRLAA